MPITNRDADYKGTPKLCYVDGPWAYFTTQSVAEQWGDDWDDAPYEHNAGEPYEPMQYHYVDGRTEPVPSDWNEDGTPKWEIKKVAWDGPFEEPSSGHFNSPYCVRDINEGAAPWLTPCVDDAEPVMAGTTLAEFRRLVRAAGGQVFECAGETE